MAIQFSGANFGTLTKPGAYVSLSVEKPQSGLSTTGVVMLVGEADSGPDYTLETNIEDNAFGPDAISVVQAKYKSGPIVDAFRTVISAANDPNITGSVSSVVICKTNVSTKASTTLARPGLASSYGTLSDKSYGSLGNMFTVSVSAATAEVPPTTGQFTYITSPVASSLKLRVNGGTTQTLTINAKTIPASIVGSVSSTANQSFNSLTLSALNTIHATGGVNRGTIDAAMVASGQKIAIDATGATAVISIDTGVWAVTPSIGDTLLIPLNGDYGAGADSVIKGATGKNAGAWVITGATSTTITATKLRNEAAGVLDNPEDVASTDILAITDILVYSPVVVNNYSGTERTILTAGLVTKTVAGTASGQNLTLVLETGSVWGALPQAGDKLLIPSTAPAAWLAAGNANGGWYQVVSATSSVAAGGSTIVLTRLSNGAPITFGATAIAAVTDFRVFRPAIDGVGKTLEIFDGGGAEVITTQFYALSPTLVSWISTGGSPKIFLSASEYASQLDIARQTDSTQESLVGTSDIALRLGYHGGGTAGVTGTMTISGTTLTTTVTGGNGANLSVDLKQFRILSDLAAYLNLQTGYVCSVGSSLVGQTAVTYMDAANVVQTVLDKGTFGIASENIGSAATVSPAGRVKKDAYAWFKKMTEQAQYVQIGTTAATILAASAGQPEAQALGFMTGGAKGSTSNAQVTGAIDVLERVRGNFLVPLFSRDATADIVDGLTDSSSTYTIDSINAYAKSHVLLMSQVKRRRSRQACLSKKGTFTEAKLAANNIASARCVMCCQDFKAVSSSGDLVQFQPWMTSVAAAGMQSAAFYKGLTKKFINSSGILMADGSFTDQLLSNVEDAILNGLMVAERAETGGFRWVEDQTTYAVDANFVFNNLQAVYVADIIALTIAQRMENAFVGQSIADTSAGLMLSYLTAIMADLKKLKLTSASDDAPLGFRGASIRISGPVAEVSLEVKLAGQILFVPISCYVSQVVQSASL